MTNSSLVVIAVATLVACAEPEPEPGTEPRSAEARASGLDRVIRIDREVAVGRGRRVAITETFTPRAWLRHPRRAVLMIPAQGSTRSVYNAPFAGYDGGEILARAGFLAVTVDPEGTGGSTAPRDGFSVTYESEAASLRAVAQRIRAERGVPRIDMLGEELGGGVAAQLCADAALARSCTMTSMIYHRGSDFFNAGVGGPQFQALIFGAPEGYFTSFPELYFNVLAGASPEMASWFLGTQLGRYAAGLYAQDFERLFANGASYDPRRAAVPGLLVMGEFDPNPAPGDTAELAAAYGSLGHAGPARVAVIAGGTHIVRLDAPPRGARFWELVLGFLDEPSGAP